MSDQTITDLFGMKADAAAEELPPRLASALQHPYDDGSAWGSMHEMALVFVALIHRGRGERSDDLTAVYTMLDMWYPEVGAERIEQVVRDALLTFISTAREQMLDVAIAALHQSMPRDQRIAVLTDLFDLALAEGFIVPGEAAFIQRLARAWDIEQDAP